MARLRSRNALVEFTAAILAACLASCNMSLEMKKELEQKVAFATKSAIQISQASTISSGGSYSFPGTIRTKSSDVQFTIKNNGGSDLLLSGNPLVSIGGAGASSFSLISQPSNKLGAGESTTFIVRFSPAAVASYDATLTVASNDGAYPGFTFGISGAGTEWHGLASIDTTGSVGTYTSMGLNGSKVYVAYRDDSNSRLNVISSDDAALTWNSKVIPDSISSGLYASLVVYNGDLYLSYSAAPVLLLVPRFVKATGGSSWGNPVTIDANGGTSTSIAVAGGKITVAYVRGGSALHTQDSTNGITWNADSGFSGAGYAPGATSYASIVDSGGNAFVAYRTASGFGIDNHNYLNDPYEWMSGSPDASSGAGQDSAMVSVGTTAYVAYGVLGTHSLKFIKAARAGSSPTSMSYTGSKTVDSTGTVGTYCSIASEDGTTIYISYYDATNKDLKLAKSIDGGTTWSLQVVDDAGDVGQYSSIKVSGPNVYISYYDFTNGDLKIAKSIDGGATW